jgi:hypothetical protein
VLVGGKGEETEKRSARRAGRDGDEIPPRVAPPQIPAPSFRRFREMASQDSSLSSAPQGARKKAGGRGGSTPQKAPHTRDAPVFFFRRAVSLRLASTPFTWQQAGRPRARVVPVKVGQGVEELGGAGALKVRRRGNVVKWRAFCDAFPPRVPSTLHTHLGPRHGATARAAVGAHRLW